MDIAVVQAALSDFSDFVSGIKAVFQGVPDLFVTLANWFSPDTIKVDETTGVAGVVEGGKDAKIGIVEAWNDTSSNIITKDER